MTDKLLQIYEGQPFIPKDSKAMNNLWFICLHRTLLSFITEGTDMLTVSARLFIECICHCSIVLCCYQHGRNTANYCNYYYVAAMTFEMNTNFEKYFIHPFCWKLLKYFAVSLWPCRPWLTPWEIKGAHFPCHTAEAFQLLLLSGKGKAFWYFLCNKSYMKTSVI